MVRSIGLVLAVLAALPALAGLPPCCIEPARDIAVAEEPACPCCKHETPVETPPEPVDYECPLTHMHWAPATDHDDAPPLPLVADAEPVVHAAPRIEPGVAAPEGLVPPRAHAALSLPLLL